jgi:hypothetical protein
VGLVAVLGLVVPAVPAAADTSSDEAWFVARINELRAARGLGQLTVDPELTGQARRWAQTMANDDQLKHSSDMSVGISADWDLLGENVGVHELARPANLRELFTAFVSSPSHLDNLVESRFERVGVGVVYDGRGKIWTAHRFMSVTGAAPSTTSAPATSQPPPTEPATTSPSSSAAPTASTRRPDPTSGPASSGTPAPSSAPSRPATPPVDEHAVGLRLVELDPELIARLLGEVSAAGL